MVLISIEEVGKIEKNNKWRSRGGGGVYFALESNYIKSALYKNSDGFNEF